MVWALDYYTGDTYYYCEQVSRNSSISQFIGVCIPDSDTVLEDLSPEQVGAVAVFVD